MLFSPVSIVFQETHKTKEQSSNCSPFPLPPGGVTEETAALLFQERCGVPDVDPRVGNQMRVGLRGRRTKRDLGYNYRYSHYLPVLTCESPACQIKHLQKF